MTINKNRLGPGKLTIGQPGPSAKGFETQVTKCELKPSVSTSDSIEVLSGEHVAGDRTESWTLTGTILDDFGTTGSIVEFCFTNRGKEMPFEFLPNNESANKVTGKAVIEATSIGGDVGKVNTVDFEFVVLDPKIAQKE